MDPVLLGTVIILALLVLVMIGMPVALALIGLSFAGVWMLRDNFELALRLLSTTSYASVSSYVYVAIPLFILMGGIISEANIGRDTFNALERLFRRAKGGLAISTVASNAVFSTVTGVSVASAAVFARIAVPEMIRHGYRDGFAAATVAGSSILGMLIPPSLLLIVYGIQAEQSIGALFIAAIVPGIIMSVAFALMIALLAKWWPRQVFSKSRPEEAVVPTEDRPVISARSGFMALLPIAVLIAVVMGGIYGGVFSPTEAGAAGAVGAAAIAVARRRLSPERLSRILRETASVSASILMLLIAASMYSRTMTMTGIPAQFALMLGEWGADYWTFFIIYAVLVLIAGMFLDAVSIMLIFLPIALPVALALGFEPIQFGILTVIAAEMALITPPFGLSVFVVQSTLREHGTAVGIARIFVGSIFFLVPMIGVLVLLAAFPQLATVLL